MSTSPCLECYRSGEQLVNTSLAPPDDRWPRFSPEARRLGFATVHALPMRLRGQVIGAVNIFGREGSNLTQSDIDVGQALADVATVGLLQERTIREARIVSEQLQGALTSRVMIEQAKGMLVERHKSSMDDAFESMRRFARRTNRRLSDVAQSILDGSLTADQLR